MDKPIHPFMIETLLDMWEADILHFKEKADRTTGMAAEIYRGQVTALQYCSGGLKRAVGIDDKQTHGGSDGA